MFLIFELSPKVIWGCRHIVKYHRNSESVGDRIMVISYTNYFLTGRKISHGKEDHWFCCAGQTRGKGSLRTTWGWFLHTAEVVAVASMPFSLTCSTLDRYKSLFHDTQEEEPWPAGRHQTLKKIWKQSTSTGKVLNIINCCGLVAQSCLTLCDLMDSSLPSSSIHGILQARILEWVAIPFSRGFPWPRHQTLDLEADS